MQICYILLAMVTNIKQVIQDVIIPEFRTLSSEIKRLDEKIDTGLKRLDEKIDTGLKRLDEKIESVRNEFEANFRRIDSEINLLKEEIKFLREEIKLSINIHERLAALEAKINK